MIEERKEALAPFKKALESFGGPGSGPHKGGGGGGDREKDLKTIGKMKTWEPKELANLITDSEQEIRDANEEIRRGGDKEAMNKKIVRASKNIDLANESLVGRTVKSNAMGIKEAIVKSYVDGELLLEVTNGAGKGGGSIKVDPKRLSNK